MSKMQKESEMEEIDGFVLMDFDIDLEDEVLKPEIKENKEDDIKITIKKEKEKETVQNSDKDEEDFVILSPEDYKKDEQIRSMKEINKEENKRAPIIETVAKPFSFGAVLVITTIIGAGTGASTGTIVGLIFPGIGTSTGASLGAFSGALLGLRFGYDKGDKLVEDLFKSKNKKEIMMAILEFASSGFISTSIASLGAALGYLMGGPSLSTQLAGDGLSIGESATFEELNKSMSESIFKALKNISNKTNTIFKKPSLFGNSVNATMQKTENEIVDSEEENLKNRKK